MGFFAKMERKYGRYAIENLMYYIIVLYVVGFIIQMFMPQVYSQYLALDISMVMKGQVWRLFTFIMQPPDSSPIFMIIALYLYYSIGTNLERVWGAFRFNVYFFMGVIFHIIAAFGAYFIFDTVMTFSTYYLNLSLFLAFACVYPDMELLLFFIIPVKMKWLGIFDGVFFAYTVFSGIYIGYVYHAPQYYAMAVSALVSMLNFVVFFLMTRNYKKVSPAEIRRKKQYKKQVNQFNGNMVHKCDICGRNSRDFPELTFRYCSKCSGNHEYCQDHLFTHEHIK